MLVGRNASMDDGMQEGMHEDECKSMSGFTRKPRCCIWAENNKLDLLPCDGAKVNTECPLPLSSQPSPRASTSYVHASVQLSTKRVITMEWVEGCRANDQESMQQASIRPKDVAVLLLDVFAEMTYVHGFVHADPHPGNILVRPAPDQGRPHAQTNV